MLAIHSRETDIVMVQNMLTEFYEVPIIDANSSSICYCISFEIGLYSFHKNSIGCIANIQLKHTS